MCVWGEGSGCELGDIYIARLSKPHTQKCPPPDLPIAAHDI